ncbi:hypothetical protein CAS74_000758 [Pichia kudriavzevii]|uniref:DUF866-domain-containing protein n=1 Tax=Pichia kudriavzevii TaxID=4909 RepID=A0A1V2LQT0_PICKU|nr:uncharacterized protein C5L36_0C07380 [Pichia kudriavzevii]AWU76822.1 hypothetical protein C5L36_0C07380 [Pichia kudriavzevii]ONH75939.1 hypothetical protein BOH78_1428 [Pichia kudriavzevii]OUT24370.1 hypothetical protein CAS74_000758 [Pichia kudriavzevii]
MVQYLYLTAELNNVTSLKPKDSLKEPFEYEFKIQCTKCRETHDKTVTVNLYEKHEIDGSRGEASYVGACSFCKAKSNINIALPKGYEGYNSENSGQEVKMLEIDSRGYEIVEFVANGPFVCKGNESTTEFQDVLLDEGEWYDYDDQAGEETSITEVKWVIR